MRLLWLLLSISMAPAVMAAEPEMGLEQSRTLEGACSNAGSPIVFSPDGRLLAFVACLKNDPGHSVVLWDLAEHKAVVTFNGAQADIGSPAFSPDGKTLAAGTLKGIKLWDVQGDKKAMGVDGPEASVWSVAFSPDGKTLATAGGEKGIIRPDYETESTVRMWRCLPVKKANN